MKYCYVIQLTLYFAMSLNGQTHFKNLAVDNIDFPYQAFFTTKLIKSFDMLISNDQET